LLSPLRQIGFLWGSAFSVLRTASDDSPAREYTDELEETDAYDHAVRCAEG
jgi:hypothetical protein